MAIDANQVEAVKKMMLFLDKQPDFKNRLQDYDATMRSIRTTLTKLPTYGGWKPGNDEELEGLLSMAGWYGPLTTLLAGGNQINAIMVNAPDKKVLVERAGSKKETNIVLSTDWIRFIVRMFRHARGLSLSVPDRYTGSLTYPPIRYTYVSSRLGVSGDSMYIRVLPRNPMKWQDLIDSKMLTPNVALFLQALIKIRVNILVSGGSGAGKTTLLTTMGTSIAPGERVIAIEDEHEVHLNEVLVNFTAYELNPEIPGVTMSDLLRNVGLKVAPERVIVGEIRGKEALDLMQAMNTGVDGSMATIHANSPVDALKKLADYIAMSDIPMPPEVIYSRVSDARLVVVQVTRLTNGQRIVSGIAECRGASKTIFETGLLFDFKNGETTRTTTPYSDYMADRLARYDIKLPF